MITAERFDQLCLSATKVIVDETVGAGGTGADVMQVLQSVVVNVIVGTLSDGKDEAGLELLVKLVRRDIPGARAKLSMLRVASTISQASG